MTQPTLILVHGAFATSFSFAPLQAELAFHGVRSAAVDLPGHGFAATFPLGYQAPQDLARFTSEPGSIRGVTVDDNVRALTEAAARAKEHGPVVIVAHSRGGATLTALANAHPELIDHMVYVSAWAPVDLPDSIQKHLRPRNPSFRQLLDSTQLFASSFSDAVGNRIAA